MKFKKGEYVQFKYRRFNKTHKAFGNVVSFRKRFYKFRTADGLWKIYGNCIKRVAIPNNAHVIEKTDSKPTKEILPMSLLSAQLTKIQEQLEQTYDRLGWFMLFVGIVLLMLVLK